MNEKRYGIVFDFDGTLTRKAVGALYKVVDDNVLPPEATAETDALREKYLAKIRDGTITDIEELHWLTETFDIYVKYGVTREMWQSALVDVRLRPGVPECLRSLRKSGVPFGIVSYGCADFIEFVLQQEGLSGLSESVHATRLGHDDGGRIVGYDRTTLVYPANKGLWSERFAEAYGIEPLRLLAVGDSNADRTLGILPVSKLIIAESEEKRMKLSATFPDVIVVPDDPGDFSSVADWIGRRLKG